MLREEIYMCRDKNADAGKHTKTKGGEESSLSWRWDSVDKRCPARRMRKDLFKVRRWGARTWRCD